MTTLTRKEIKAIDKELDSKVTSRVMEHENYRFGYMDQKQLKTRVFKMTNVVKLHAFAQVARGLGYNGLARIARQKRDVIYTTS